MRVNIYGEELTNRIEVVTKQVEEGEGIERTVYTFYGLRFWLKFPNQPWWVHRKVDQVEDDDSTAVTFWDTSLEELEGRFREAIGVLQANGSKFSTGVPSSPPRTSLPQVTD